MVGTWLGEICSCSCLTVLWFCLTARVLLNKDYQYFIAPLYKCKYRRQLQNLMHRIYEKTSWMIDGDEGQKARMPKLFSSLEIYLHRGNLAGVARVTCDATVAI